MKKRIDSHLAAILHGTECDYIRAHTSKCYLNGHVLTTSPIFLPIHVCEWNKNRFQRSATATEEHVYVYRYITIIKYFKFHLSDKI